MGPSIGPLCHLPTTTPGQGGVGEGAIGGHAERREFSGLLLSVLVSLPCLCQEGSGAKPQTLFHFLCQERESETFLGEGEFLSCLPLFAVVS